MKVTAFNGSPRPAGNTAALIQEVLRVLDAEGIQTETVQVGGKSIHGCRACFKCMKNKDRRCSLDDDILNDCLTKMAASDGIVLGSPTYFADMTAEMKALIDRAGLVSRANGDMLQRKVGAAVVAARRAGTVHTIDSINHFFGISQMIVPGANYWNMGFGLNKGDVANDTEGIQTMNVLGQNMAWLLKKIAA